jgi:hypothetical protein
MAQIINLQLNNAKFFVGPKLIRLQGAADDYFTISLGSDVGAGMGGIQGDVMLSTREQNLYTASLTLLQGSAAIGTLLGLKRNYFKVKIGFNDFSFNGKAVLVSVGDWVASLGTQTRTMTLAMAYESGNVDTGVGENISA